MKVSEYLPYYGLLFNFEYQTGIEGKKMTVNEMFENYPDFELTDIHINQLFYFDLHSLQTSLQNNYFTPDTVVSYLRELFDDFRQAGGNPFDWLQITFESINLNPQSYKAELRATLEKTLIEWIEIYNKQPIDYLYYNTNPEALPPQQPETKTDKLKAPVLGLFCSLINKIGIDKRGETESAKVYCERICVKFKLPYTDRVRQNYNVNETKRLIQELTENVLPLIDNETKISVQKYFQIFR
jgi:hypothetical protein